MPYSITRNWAPQYRFYLFGQTQETGGGYDLRWTPSAVYLADNAAKTPTLRKFMIQPDWAATRDPGPLSAHAGHGWLPRFHAGKFTVYEIMANPRRTILRLVLCQTGRLLSRGSLVNPPHDPAEPFATWRRAMKSRRSWLPHVAVALALAGFVLALFARLLFTDRVLASGDILHYFYPYRDYAAAAFRAGRIPLWNPYHLCGRALSRQSPGRGALSPALAPELAGRDQADLLERGPPRLDFGLLGGYWLMRRWGYSAWAGLITGLILAGSGFYGGLLGHLNQMNGVAWLPWMVLSFDADGQMA